MATVVDLESLTDPRAFLAHIRQLEAIVPGLRPLTTEQMSALRRAASLDPRWVNDAITTSGASEAIGSALARTPEELRQEVLDNGVWFEAELAVRGLLAGLSGGNLVRQHRVGLLALQIYGIARQLVRQPEHHHLRPFVEQLRQMNRMGKRKKKEEGGATEDAPG